MKAKLWQKVDGTVLRQTEFGAWEYLSPLFGEWLNVFGPNKTEIEPYPRNLNIPTDQLHARPQPISN